MSEYFSFFLIYFIIEYKKYFIVEEYKCIYSIHCKKRIVNRKFDDVHYLNVSHTHWWASCHCRSMYSFVIFKCLQQITYIFLQFTKFSSKFVDFGITKTFRHTYIYTSIIHHIIHKSAGDSLKSYVSTIKKCYQKSAHLIQ